MNYDREDEVVEAVSVRRSRRDQSANDAPARLDRLERALHATDEALGALSEKLSPVLGPEGPSGIDGAPTEEPRSELAARLERMCDQAEAHRSFIRGLTERVDL